MKRVASAEEIIAKWDGMTPRERDVWVFYDVLGLMPLDTIPNEFGGFGTIPRYTTDISAAWSVFERMNADHYVKVERISEHVNVTGDYVAEIGEHIGWGTAPEAICLAAILAKLTD